MQHYIIVNDTDRIPLYVWGAASFNDNSQLHLATDNLVYVKNLFANLQKIQVFNALDEEVARYTGYDGISSIAYAGNNYSIEAETFLDDLIVTLQKTSLVEQVERLDHQVNPVIDFNTMTLEELKEYKIAQFSKMGREVIFAGTDVTLINGIVKNFTYNMEDQSNLLNAIFIIQTLGDLTISLPYHGHAEPCELYNAKDILAVYFTLQFYSTRIQTEVNMRNNWVRSCETKEEVEAITFETPLPEAWVERAEAIMGPAMELAAQLQATYFGPVEPIVGEEE